jgi:hypothetical protein
MAQFHITAMYEYEGTVEAKTEQEAEQLFLADLNDYYSSTYSLEIEQIQVCANCGFEESYYAGDFDPDYLCEDCEPETDDEGEDA